VTTTADSCTSRRGSGELAVGKSSVNTKGDMPAPTGHATARSGGHQVRGGPSGQIEHPSREGGWATMSGGGHDRSEAGEPGSGNGDRRGGEERGQRWKGRLSGDPPARKGKEETSGVLGDAGNHPH
jgi:hypothetical protein